MTKIEEILCKFDECWVETLKKDADYQATNLELYRKEGCLGITYHLTGKYEEDVMVSLPGEFSVHNSLSAIAVAKEMGVPMEQILKILTKQLTFLVIFFRCVPAIHPTQGLVTTTLQRKMKMRTHLRQCRNGSCKFFCNNSWLQRP